MSDYAATEITFVAGWETEAGDDAIVAIRLDVSEGNGPGGKIEMETSNATPREIRAALESMQIIAGLKLAEYGGPLV